MPEVDELAPQPGGITSLRDISVHCPRSVDWVAELPRNPSCKILKTELRQPFWEGRERQVN